MYTYTYISLAYNCEDIISLQVYPNESIIFLSFYVIILSCIIGYNSSLKWEECNKMSESKKKTKKASLHQVFSKYSRELKSIKSSMIF